MTKKNPVKLRKDPIVEAIFEIRFDASINQVSEILPGMLFPQLKDSFPNIEALPTAQLPLTIRQSDPNLTFKPTHRLVGDLFSISIGEKVVSLNCPRPYQGWADFRLNIIKLIDILKGTDIIDTINRFSVKYINVISVEKGDLGLDKLKLQVNLGDNDLLNNHTSINTQLKIDPFLNIVNIVPGAFAKINKTAEVLNGLILDIDTIFDGGIGISWSQLVDSLDHAHDTEKAIFYSVLKEETIEEYDPVWE